MAFLMDTIVEKHFPRRETVLLHFDKADSQIVRNWQKSAKIKVVLGDKSKV